MTVHPASDRFASPDPSFGDAVEGPGAAAHAERSSGSRWRGLFAWSATTAPVGLLLAAGIALGPSGINLLSRQTLTLLDPVMPVALAALGVLVGVNLAERRTLDRRVIAAAWVGAALAALIVSLGFTGVTVLALSSGGRPLRILYLAVGLCAASSLTLPSDHSMRPSAVVTRLIELGVLVPVVAGGVILAGLHAGSGGGAAILVASMCALTLAVAAAAWLLLTRAAKETDERVYVVSALLLVGGVAAAKSGSALLAGLVAGLFWRFAGRRPRETVRRDVLFVQHPLLVLVLLVAGARAELSLMAVALGGLYLGLRTAGQLLSGALARRLLAAEGPRDCGLHLLSPGVFGAGFALNAVGVLGDDAAMLLATVVVGTIGAELIAVAWPPRSGNE